LKTIKKKKENIENLYKEFNEIKQGKAEPIIQKMQSFLTTPRKGPSTKLTHKFSSINNFTKDQELLNEENVSFLENISIIPEAFSLKILDQLEDGESNFLFKMNYENRDLLGRVTCLS
jgi:hypothetical protein